MVVAKDVVCLDCLVQMVHLVGMEFQEDPVLQVLLDFLEDHRRYAKR